MNIRASPSANNANLVGRPRAGVFLARTPTEYANIRQWECPRNCCAGDATVPMENAITKRPVHFPVDPLKDTRPSPPHGLAAGSSMFFDGSCHFHRHESGGHQSAATTTTSNEFDEPERLDEGFQSSNESSTQSLLIWQRNQLQKQREKAATNGAFLRLHQKTRYSMPQWWSSNDDNSPTPLASANIHASRKEKALKITGQSNKCCFFHWTVGFLLLLAICLLFGTIILIIQQNMELHRKLTNTQEPYDRLLKENVQKQNDTSAHLMAFFNASRIHESLQWIASTMHIAGTDEQLQLMDKLAHEYNSLGFNVETFEYPEVLLSTMDFTKPNTISAWNERLLRWESISNGIGGLSKDSGATVEDEELKRQLETDPRIHVWWNAYAKNGTALGELVYANYGTSEDFEMLQKVNITVVGKIVLIRYGGIFRGDKVHLAESRGAVGVILYSDPFDYVPGGNQTFPDDLWLPPSGSQRGTLYRGIGDPETPFLPSLPYVNREFEDQNGGWGSALLPDIPVTSIGYGHAQRLFARMNGPPVQWSRWIGSLPGIYRISGGSLLIRMDVNSRNERRPIRNFIAKMDGREEPDRWVLLGNHADAWTTGSIDPGTGTSIMLEMARVLSTYANLTGWRPRRTIVFCQWDAEEFGLIGSTEWVEQNLRLLQSRAVAYLNVDNFNGNTTLSIKAVPLLYRILVDAASRVPQPVESERQNGRETLLDSWRFHNPRSTLPGDRSVPFFQLPHSGSDFQPFISFAGIPAADVRMENVPYSYMLYHTAYEVPWLNAHFLDQNSETSVALGRFWLETVRQLADYMVIPFNAEDYAIALADFVAKTESQMMLLGVHEALGIEFFTTKLAFLKEALRKFHQSATKFQRLIQLVNSGEKAISLREREQLNHRLLSLERCFLMDRALNEARPQLRHAIFSAPQIEQNSGSSLPLLLDPSVKWFEASESDDPVEADEQLARIRMAFSWLQYCVECAQQVLQFDQDL